MTSLENKNIVLLVMDTVSAFNTSLTEGDRDTTPFLAELAEKNTVCNFAYSNAPWTVPSHASIFTGDLPADHNTTTKNMNLKENKLTKSLASKGYKTIGYSLNELICPELGFNEGFDKLLVKDQVVLENSVGEDSYSAWNEVQRREYNSDIEKYIDFLRSSISEKEFKSIFKGFESLMERTFHNHVAEVPAKYQDKGAGDINDLILRDFSEMSNNSDLFVFANYIEAHEFEVPENTKRKFISVEESREPSSIVSTSEGFPELDDQQLEKVRRIYDTEISYLDQKIQELFEEISTDYEDTVFIITSDHGQNLGHYDGVWDHQFGIWERLIRVPLVIAGDGVPNIEIDDNVPLRSLYDLIKGEKEIEELGREKVFSEYSGAFALRSHEGEEEGVDEDHMQDQKDLLNNESKAVVKKKRGYIKNSHIDNSSFAASYNFSGTTEQLDSINDLEKVLENRFKFSGSNENKSKDQKIKDKLSKLGYR